MTCAIGCGNHNLVLDLQGQENWEVQSVEAYINKKEGGQ